jgi:hypothetical protein
MLRNVSGSLPIWHHTLSTCAHSEKLYLHFQIVVKFQHPLPSLWAFYFPFISFLNMFQLCLNLFNRLGSNGFMCRKRQSVFTCFRLFLLTKGCINRIFDRSKIGWLMSFLPTYVVPRSNSITRSWTDLPRSARRSRSVCSGLPWPVAVGVSTQICLHIILYIHISNV